MGLFNTCKHNYDILQKYELESQFEKLTKLGVEINKGSREVIQSKLIIVYKCSKCNNIKESVHNNFD